MVFVLLKQGIEGLGVVGLGEFFVGVDHRPPQHHGEPLLSHVEGLLVALPNEGTSVVEDGVGGDVDVVAAVVYDLRDVRVEGRVHLLRVAGIGFRVVAKGFLAFEFRIRVLALGLGGDGPLVLEGPGIEL